MNKSVETMQIKDSGNRQEFSTGSRRDTNDGKVRPDLLPCTCEFMEGAHFAAGSIKYGDRNWEKGQPIMRYFESLRRHILYWALGDTSENHLAGARWNLATIQHTLLMIEHGLLPKELDDRPVYMKPGNPVGAELMRQFDSDMRIMKAVLASKSRTVPHQEAVTNAPG
jgi:hypothetical protein